MPLLDPETEFRADLHLVPEGGEGFAHPFLAGVWPVYFRRIEKGHASVVGATNQRYHVLLVVLTAIVTDHRQAAEPDGRYIQTSYLSVFHTVRRGNVV